MAKKRDRDHEGDIALPDDAAGSPSGGGTTTTNFRNVSACNRCRNRKNRCDQKLPKCTNCAKANVKCVGFDPVSKREIPRSYVYYLETRLVNLEAILDANNLSYPPPHEDFAISDAIKPGVNVPFPVLEDEPPAHSTPKSPLVPHVTSTLDPALKELDEGAKLDNLVNNIGMVSFQGASSSRFAPSTAGISFANVVFAAVKRSVHPTTSMPPEKSTSKPPKLLPTEIGSGGTTMRDSFFGLHSKPTIKPAPFPEKELGYRLTELYFEHANPQIPVLHRPEFMSLFERVYATDHKKRTPRELYLLNIVFAIGSGIIMDSSNVEQTMAATEGSSDDFKPPSKKRARMANQQHQPEEYHASAIIHLESFLGSSPATEGVGGGLEELQAVLLLAGLALLRPVAPGLWYIIGVAVRLSIDLGLHFEDLDDELDTRATHADSNAEGGEPANGLGRKQWTRDLRRRLWWCVFNLDRLVSSCVGRPVSINEAVVTTEFPSLLDDRHITPSGFLLPPNQQDLPSYKLVTHHYIRLRLLQSEILQVLQYRQADQARKLGANRDNQFLSKTLESQFMKPFSSYREWRSNIDGRLREWKDSAPTQSETGVAFSPLFLELNYWQAIIMLYRQSLSVPEPLASELSPATGEDIQSPSAFNLEQDEDQQMVFLKVAQAGQTVLKTYRQLHRLKLVNYTFLATHHLFMSGVSFLYAIWHSNLVRTQLTIDDVDFTILAATSVLTDLIEMCPPAESCRDAFVRMSKATISMVMSTTGFGATSILATQPLRDSDGYFGIRTNTGVSSEGFPSVPQDQRKQAPRFDMNLKDLFSSEELAGRPSNNQSRLQQFFGPPLKREKQTPSYSERLPTNSSPQSNEGASQQYSQLDHHRRTSNTSYQTAAANPQNTYTTYPDNGPHTTQPDYSFDNLDFLADFPVADPGANAWGQTNELDQGGTAGFDGSGAWEANAELFGDSGFFFAQFGNGAGY